MRTLKHIFLALCVVPLAACTADVGDSDVEEEIGTAKQAEVYACDEFTTTDLQSVKVNQELTVTNVSVVDDSCRTTWDAGCSTSTKGKWTFWNLMTQMAGSNNVSRFVLKWLESFEEQPVVNGQSLMLRSKVRLNVIDPWRSASGCANGSGEKYDTSPCTLDGTKAPFRLLAVVNRMDLRSASDVSAYGGGNAGEGRLVFGFIRQTGANLQGTVIFEYKLPTPIGWSPLAWAQKWRQLGTNFTTINETYKANLQVLTDKFTSSNATTGNPNFGSAINQVRVNEIDFDPATPSSSRRWSLREFKLGCLPSTSCGTNDKFLVNVPVAQTPDDNINGTSTLTTFLNSNTTSILNENHVIPLTFGGAPFQGAESRSKPFFSGPFFWEADTLLTPAETHDDVRRLFAMSTCNGCHYAETETNNFHVQPRNVGSPSTLSPFMSTTPTGTPHTLFNIFDSNGNPVEFNETRRRACEHLWLLGNNDTPLTTTAGRPH